MNYYESIAPRVPVLRSPSSGSAYPDPRRNLAAMVREAESILTDMNMDSTTRDFARLVIDIAADAFASLARGDSVEACATGIAVVEAYERMWGAANLAPELRILNRQR